MADGTIITDSQGDESLTKRRKNFMKRVHNDVETYPSICVHI
jgi:hypothetical protein